MSQRLINWGRWCRVNFGLGYKTPWNIKAPVFYFSDQEIDEQDKDCGEINRAIVLLQYYEHDLYEVIWQRYVMELTVKFMAEKRKVSRATIRGEIERATYWIDGRLIK